MSKHLALLLLMFIVLSNRLLSQTILGTDVYAGQGTITWSSVASSSNGTFSFIKATKGTCYTDGNFYTNIANANSAGVTVGAYHFALPEDNTATAEAAYFLNTASGYIGNGYLPPVLDLEDPAGTCLVNSTPLTSYFTSADLTAWVVAWCQYVQNATGVAPIVYTNGSIANYLGSGVTTYGLWMADPDGNSGTPPATTGIWSTWLFKQYSWTGSVSGISGSVDLDVFNGDITAFDNLIGVTPSCSGWAVSPTSASYSSSGGTGSFTVTTTVGGCSYSAVSGNSWITNVTSSGSTVSYSVSANSMCSSQTGYIYVYDASNTLQATFTITESALSAPGSVIVNGGGTSCSSATLTASGGSGGTIYWQGTTSNGTSIATPSTSETVSSSGTYYYNAYNSCGWGPQGSATVTISSLPASTTVSGGGTYCNSATLTASGGSGGIIYWQGTNSNGTSTATPSTSQIVTSSGTYYFRAYNSCGWGMQGSVSVTVNPIPSVSVSPQVTPICANQQATFIANGSGIISYSWSGQGVSGQSGQSATPSPNYSSSGTYTVTVTVNSGNNCTATASGSITVSPNVVPTISLLQSPNPICANGSNAVTITAQTTNSGSNPSYSWSNSGGNANGNQYIISNVSSGTNVSCTLTSNANCASPTTASNNINVQVIQPVTPSVSISSSTTSLCVNSPLTLSETISNGPGGVQPSSITWYSDGNQIGTGSPFIYSGWSGSGSHTITCTIQYGANACVTNASITSSNSLSIMVQTQAPAGLSVQASSSVICQNMADTFTANPSNGGSSPQYQWKVNGVNEGINSAVFTSSTLNNNDIITCFITSNSSCAVPDTATSTNSVTVTVNPSPTANAGDDTSVCAGNPVILNGVGNGNCSWKPTIGLSDSSSCTPTCTTNSSRIYTLTITNTDGCKATAQVAVTINSGTIPSPNDSITSLTTSGNGFVACFKNISVNATSIRWDFGDSTSSNINTPCHIYKSCGPYIVTLTAYNECGSSSDSNSTQFVVSCPTGINELPIVENLAIIPNPSTGLFTINFNVNQEKQIQIQIYDLIGRLIQVEDPINANGFYSKQINLSNAAKGIYIVQLKAEGQTENRKIEIK